MRLLIFALCLLGHLSGISQTSPGDKTISVSELGNWVNKKASQVEVARAFGPSTQETITPVETVLEYKRGGGVYTLYFDQDRKLARLSFLNQAPVAAQNLSYDKIKAAKGARTEQEILTAFGRPNQLAVTNVEEVWYYSVSGNDGSKGLVVFFDQAHGGQLRRFSYSEEVNRETALASSITASFHLGTSTISEVEKVLGKPSKLTLESEGEERWYYHSQTSSLVVIFDGESKLRDFSFHRSAN